MITTSDYNKMIEEEFDKLRNFAVDKNTLHDSGVFELLHVFDPSQSPAQRIAARIDDKLYQVKTYADSASFSPVSKACTDLIVYLVVARVNARVEEQRLAIMQQSAELSAASGPVELQQVVQSDRRTRSSDLAGGPQPTELSRLIVVRQLCPLHGGEAPIKDCMIRDLQHGSYDSGIGGDTPMTGAEIVAPQEIDMHRRGHITILGAKQSTKKLGKKKPTPRKKARR